MPHLELAPSPPLNSIKMRSVSLFFHSQASAWLSEVRHFLTLVKLSPQIEGINEAFVTARDEIEYAKEVGAQRCPTRYKACFRRNLCLELFWCLCWRHDGVGWMQDCETVYFNESHEAAKAAVSKTLELFEAVLSKLEESEKGKLQRSMGLKMEQLKV
jgi:hypothetical protein